MKNNTIVKNVFKRSYKILRHMGWKELDSIAEKYNGYLDVYGELYAHFNFPLETIRGVEWQELEKTAKQNAETFNSEVESIYGHIPKTIEFVSNKFVVTYGPY